MNKTIEKIEYYKRTTLDHRLEVLNKDYAEARASYNDSGYDRYWNKMQRIEEEINELTEYRSRDDAIDASIRAMRATEAELEVIKKTLKNKVFYLKAVVPDCSEIRSVEEYIDKL